METVKIRDVPIPPKYDYNGEAFRSESNRELKKKRNLTEQDKQRMKEGRLRKFQCTKCGIFGHFARDCRRGFCSREGHTGHYAKDCPDNDEAQNDAFHRTNREKRALEGKLENHEQELHMAIMLRNVLGNAIKFSPNYRKFTRKEVHYLETENKKNKELNSIATKCIGEIDNYELEVIIDTGAAVCVISKEILDKLDLEIEEPLKTVLILANGKKSRSLGKINNVIVYLERKKTLVNFEVVDCTDEMIILGTNWCIRNNAILSFEKETLSFGQENNKKEIGIEVVGKEMNFRTEIDDELEFEDEELFEQRL
jgi:hypothetical protein